MMPRFLCAGGVSLALLGFAACSSTTVSDTPTVGGGEAGPGSPGDDGGTSSEIGSASEGGTIGSAIIPPPSACPTAKYKTLVVVGDSISDVGGGGGGTGQQPFYRTLLVKNDDTAYPEWKGFDLATSKRSTGMRSRVRAAMHRR